jgi:hypothetical protein
MFHQHDFELSTLNPSLQAEPRWPPAATLLIIALCCSATWTGLYGLASMVMG